MQWSWKTKFQNNILITTFTITLCQMRTKIPHTSSKCQELAHSKSATRECSSSQSSREDIGQIANSSLISARWLSWTMQMEKIVPSILPAPPQWRREATACLPKKLNLRALWTMGAPKDQVRSRWMKMFHWSNLMSQMMFNAEVISSHLKTWQDSQCSQLEQKVFFAKT